MAERTKVCKNCRFYQHQYEPLEAVPSFPTGECRIVAPVGGSGGRGWPLVVLQDWCPAWDAPVRELQIEPPGDRATCTECSWNVLVVGNVAPLFNEHDCLGHPVENLPEAEHGE